MIKLPFKKLLILSLMIVVGVVLQLFGFFDVENLLMIAREYADHWWMILVLILVQVLLFTFALAGSLIFWVTAPLYPPLTATLILASGATLGGLGAYYFSEYIADEWIKKIENSHAYKMLHKEDNFFTLFALRIFPAFPQALVNYSSGILKVKISHFVVAAFLGVGIKSYIYADIVYGLSTTASINDLLNFSTIAPLVGLSLVTIIGVFIKYKISKDIK